MTAVLGLNAIANTAESMALRRDRPLWSPYPDNAQSVVSCVTLKHRWHHLLDRITPEKQIEYNKGLIEKWIKYALSSKIASGLEPALIRT